MKPEEILHATDQTFVRLVNDDTRDLATVEDHRNLRSPLVFDRWHDTLQFMALQVKVQLRTRREQFLASMAELRSQILTQEQVLADHGLSEPYTGANFKAGSKGEAARNEIRSLNIAIENLRAEYHGTRSKTMRFNSSLQLHLLEAEQIRTRSFDRTYGAVSDTLVDQVTNVMETVMARHAQVDKQMKSRILALEYAIRRHREYLNTEEITPSKADEALWDALQTPPPPQAARKAS